MTRNRVADYLHQAKDLLSADRREEALECVKQALAADPGEMVITEVILDMERTSGPGRLNTGTQPTSERKDAGDMDPKLEKAFRLSDEALSAGNEAKALAYLKRALQLFPGDPEAEERLELLKIRIQAGNLVKIGTNKLAEGDLRKAVAASRKAFQLMPEAPGLTELIAEIEEAEQSMVDEPEGIEEPDYASGTEDTEEPEDVPDNGAMLWADRIRAAVKEEKFEEAGKMVMEAVKAHPEDSLLDSFHIKLKRLGFAR